MGRTVINIQETIGKTVGRRLPPTDPLRVRDSTREQAREWERAFPTFGPRKGVYRFRTHEEANAWTLNRRSQGRKARAN